MSSKTIHLLFDDMSEGEVEADAGTIEFGYQGRSYEIDLSQKNADEIDKDMQRWIKHARLVDSGSRRAQKRTRTSAVAPATPRVQKPLASGYSKDQLAEIRNWARRNGHEVSDRGRIPEIILQAFQENAGRNPAFLTANT